MKRLKWLPLVLSSAMVAGCMSLEERLASNDPQVKRDAELELVTNSRRNGTEADRIAAIKRVTDKEILIALSAGATGPAMIDGKTALEKLHDEQSLVRVCCTASTPEIAKAALEKVKTEKSFESIALQASNEALAMDALKRIKTDALLESIAMKGKSIKVRRTALSLIQDANKKQNIENKLKKELQMAELRNSKAAMQKLELWASKNRAKYGDSPSKLSKQDAKNVMRNITAHEVWPDLRNLMEKHRHNDNDMKVLLEAFVETRNTHEEIYAFWKGCGSGAVRSRLTDIVAVRASNFSDTAIVKDFLTARDGYHLAFQDSKVRIPLMKKLSEAEIVEVLEGDFKELGWDDWNNAKIFAIEEVIAVLPQFKSPELAAKCVSMVFKKIAGFKADCGKSYSMRWSSSDDKRVADIVARIPTLNDETMKCLFVMDENSFMFLKDRVTESVAYTIITSGVAKNQESECELAAKLSSQKCDMKVYNGAKYASTKNAIAKLMPAEFKKEVAAAAEKAYSEICAKARSSAKDTFVLDGFYLGMSFDDAKIVLQHNFPKLAIEEAVDGEGKNADYAVYVDGQRSPFCYARVSDKKVWQFNFGKKLLKKWYQYDVQTPREWAFAYGKATKADMRFKLLEKDTTVYERDGSDSYRVWFHQESYQYKHNTKEYRLTYFGEEKDYTSLLGNATGIGDCFRVLSPPDVA